jgi:hypothetical protein
MRDRPGKKPSSVQVLSERTWKGSQNWDYGRWEVGFFCGWRVGGGQQVQWENHYVRWDACESEAESSREPDRDFEELVSELG